MGRKRTIVLAATLIAGAMLAGSVRADCTCRAFGRNFALGHSACLATPQGPRLAVCGMVLNNTSWRFSEIPCAVASESGGRPDARPARALRRGG